MSSQVQHEAAKVTTGEIDFLISVLNRDATIEIRTAGKALSDAPEVKYPSNAKEILETLAEKLTAEIGHSFEVKESKVTYTIAGVSESHTVYRLCGQYPADAKTSTASIKKGLENIIDKSAFNVIAEGKARANEHAAAASPAQ